MAEEQKELMSQLAPLRDLLKAAAGARKELTRAIETVVKAAKGKRKGSGGKGGGKQKMPKTSKNLWELAAVHGAPVKVLQRSRLPVVAAGVAEPVSHRDSGAKEGADGSVPAKDEDGEAPKEGVEKSKGRRGS